MFDLVLNMLSQKPCLPCITSLLTSFKPKTHNWDKVFKNEPSKTCGRQPLKNLKGYGLLDHIPSNFLKAAFHKFYLVHS